MLRSRAFALLLAVVLLALPATSFAQSAGDDQYQDPLAGQGGGSTSDDQAPSGSTGTTGGGTTGGGTTGTGTTGTSGSTTAPTTTTGTPPTTVASSGAEGSPTPPGELPRTGGSPIMVSIFGFAMLLMGTGLRAAVPSRD